MVVMPRAASKILMPVFLLRGLVAPGSTPEARGKGVYRGDIFPRPEF